MGLKTGKVMDCTTRTKACRICKNAEKTGKKAKVHDCRINHFASSKAMEPLAAVDLFTRSLKSNVKLSVYTGDDDSTTAYEFISFLSKGNQLLSKMFQLLCLSKQRKSIGSSESTEKHCTTCFW